MNAESDAPPAAAGPLGRPIRPRRAELVFSTGPMDSGKSTLALQMAHTQASHDRQGRLFTGLDRSGQAIIGSRIGLARRAVEVGPGLDFWARLVAGPGSTIWFATRPSSMPPSRSINWPG